jgi:pimeloyl-ACP methyl ester carboxylesterase
VIEETTVEVDGVRVFVRRKPGDGPPALLVHGNPTHSEDWLPFLRRIDGPAIALDLPGWGSSDRPDPNRFDGSMEGLAAFLAVPLLPGYRWHWLARYFWRRPLVGELFLATTTRPALALILRQANAARGPMPAEFVDTIWGHFDRGTKRAILELYRSAPEAVLAAAGAGLSRLECPALVVWGARDPYLPIEFGRAYAELLPHAELLELPDAGHWPWIDRPDLIDTVVRFLEPS